MDNPEHSVSEKWARKYFTLFTGQAFSIFGSGLVQFALVWYLTKETGSATVLAIATLVAILPETVLSPIAGTVVDRWDRRKIMIFADAFVAMATVVLVVLFATGLIQIWHIYIIMAARSAGGIFHFSAMNASTRMLVPSDQLQRVSGFNQMLRAGVSIIAPPAGAFLIEAQSMQNVLLIDVATAFLGVLPVLFMSIPMPKRDLDEDGKHKTSMLQDMKEGFAYIAAWPGLIAISALALVLNFILTPTGSLLPLLVTKHFGLGALEFGLLDSVLAFGMVLGGLLLGVWGGFKKKINTALTGIIGIGAGVLVVGLTPANTYWLAMLGMSMIGLTNPIANGALGAILQSTVKPEMQGRVMGVLVSLATLMSPLSLVISGPVSDVIGIRTWYWAGGLICLLLGVASFFIPVIMEVESNRREDIRDG